MIRPFIPHQDHVYFTSTVHAKTSPSPGASVVIVDTGAKGVVVDYSKEGTEEDISDDYVAIQLSKGDEAKGQTVWVHHDDFGHLEKRY